MIKTYDLLNKIISELKNLGSIEACAITTRDGILLSSDMPEGVTAETFAAMSATMLGAAETVSMELSKGLPHKVVVESVDNIMICMGAGPKALLVVMAQPDVGLGLILVELEKAAAKIKEIM